MIAFAIVATIAYWSSLKWFLLFCDHVLPCTRQKKYRKNLNSVWWNVLAKFDHTLVIYRESSSMERKARSSVKIRAEKQIFTSTVEAQCDVSTCNRYSIWNAWVRDKHKGISASFQPCSAHDTQTHARRPFSLSLSLSRARKLVGFRDQLVREKRDFARALFLFFHWAFSSTESFRITVRLVDSFSLRAACKLDFSSRREKNKQARNSGPREYRIVGNSTEFRYRV